MAKKKEVKKDSKKASKTKSLKSALTKSVSKLTQKVVAAVSKTSKKVTPAQTPKKTEKIVKSVKSTVKPSLKSSVLKPSKTTEKMTKKKVPVVETEVEAEAHEAEENTGDTLIGMARAEMAAVKIGQTSEKAEKASKFKAIKVERGNLADEKAKWQELNKRHGKDKAEAYKMTATFEALKPIQHKVLGWGFVLTNENDRLEVLFENGIKMLISNYKPN